ncbi:hypothetical protein PoB_004031900 [Plakobranchus ocellatus]|uniref:Uncharacterized protein n=1 Tax=Plakobranchus ocellatus TaxID=259542 RepID=A0AAV4B621_9GAST|nr:hypothetical protein PoB_004031900 [Plakobranchus ocellatus]
MDFRSFTDASSWISSQVTSSPVVLHDGDETETDDETHDSNDLVGMCFEGKALSKDNFLPVNEVLDLLTGDTLETVLASVSACLWVGRNMFGFCRNSDNVIRRKGGKKSEYWDDCGAWVMEQRQAHHPHCTQGKTD